MEEIEKVIQIIDKKIEIQEYDMRRLSLHNMEIDGHFRLIQKLKECKEVLEILEEI